MRQHQNVFNHNVFANKLLYFRVSSFYPLNPDHTINWGRRKNDVFTVAAMQPTQYRPQLLFDCIYFSFFV